jgi:hypothetical protein
VQVRVTPLAGGTLLSLRHQAVGMIDPSHRENVNLGWARIVKTIKEESEK